MTDFSSNTHLVDVGSPPREVLRCTSVEYGKEYENTSDSHRAVQRRAQNKVEAAPPALLPALDKHAKEKTEQGPTAIVGTRGGRNVVEPTKEEGYVDLGQPLHLREDPLPQEVDGNRENSTDEEEPEQRPIQCSLLEEPTGAKSAPDHATVEVSTRKGAREAVGCGLWVADIGDMIQGPVEDGNLAKSTDDEANNLD